MKRTDRTRAVLALTVAAVALGILSLFLGPADLTTSEVWQALRGEGETRHRVIVQQLRLPRMLLAFAVGAALAGAGVVFQGLFRNPLADPFVVGVSGGAALGAVAAIVLGLPAGLLGLGGITLAAFVGALLTVGTVYRLSARGGRVPLTTLLLVGFAIGSLASALVSILMLLHTGDTKEILVWLFGSLDRPDAWTRLQVALPFLALSLGTIAFFSRELNLLLLGEEPAQQLGVDVERTKRILLIAGAVASGTAVSLCGIIGFVGLLVPHIVRLLVGPDHRTLLPVTILAGGAFLIGADLLAKSALPPAGLPVGTVTALVGAPFFLVLLVRKSG